MAVGSSVLASEYNSLWSQLNTIKTRLTGSGQTDSVSAGTVATAAKINTLINATNALRTNTYGQWADWSRTESTKSAGSLIKELSNLKYTLNYLRDHICARCANCETTTGPMTGNTVRGGTQGGQAFSQSGNAHNGGRNSFQWTQTAKSNGDTFSGDFSFGYGFAFNQFGWSQTFNFKGTTGTGNAFGFNQSANNFGDNFGGDNRFGYNFTRDSFQWTQTAKENGNANTSYTQTTYSARFNAFAVVV